MTRLGAFLEGIKTDARAAAVVAAAGVFAVLSATQAQAADFFPQENKIVVDDIGVAWDLNERVSDQLTSMKPLSNALQYSLSFGSPNVSSIQKAKNLAIAFEYSLQQAAHPEYAGTDPYLVSPPNSPYASQELRDMVEIVNAKKMELMEFSSTLNEIERALVTEDGGSLEYWSDKLSKMAEDVEEKLHSDISVGYEELAPSSPSADKI
jgi:hypothetical protein